MQSFNCTCMGWLRGVLTSRSQASIQRGADFVAHQAHELALRLIGSLLSCHHQCSLCSLHRYHLYDYTSMSPMCCHLSELSKAAALDQTLPPNTHAYKNVFGFKQKCTHACMHACAVAMACNLSTTPPTYFSYH
jgi:hypothetical protein